MPDVRSATYTQVSCQCVLRTLKDIGIFTDKGDPGASVGYTVEKSFGLCQMSVDDSKYEEAYTKPASEVHLTCKRSQI